MATSLLEQAPSKPSVSDRGTYSTESLSDDPDADIILRSRDDLDYRVRCVFLVKSSRLLNGLIQAASDHSETAPVGAREALPLFSCLKEARSFIFYHILTSVTPVLPPTLKEIMYMAIDASGLHKLRVTTALYPEGDA